MHLEDRRAGDRMPVFRRASEEWARGEREVPKIPSREPAQSTWNRIQRAAVSCRALRRAG